jgi:hypothetical protein
VVVGWVTEMGVCCKEGSSGRKRGFESSEGVSVVVESNFFECCECFVRRIDDFSCKNIFRKVPDCRSRSRDAFFLIGFGVYLGAPFFSFSF